MPLSIIKGPPNSGRTAQVRRAYEEQVLKRPVLVVPSTDDIFDWERRLNRKRSAFLGARVMHFKDLVGEILELGPADRERTASALRRRNLVEQALWRSWKWLAERIDGQPGLIDSVLELIDEFRAARISPSGLSLDIETGTVFLNEIAAVYGSYVELLDDSGLTDLPQLAMKAVGQPLDDWQGRPIFVAGFDDLSTQQLDLLEKLAEVTEVTVAITHEVGNPAMAVTETLLQRLESRGGAVIETTDRTDRGEHSQLLFEIERNFMRPGRTGTLTPGEGLTVMTSSGYRGETEAVATEIAKLIEDGVSPGEIAIAVTAPAVNGGRFQANLARFGVQATLECETSAAATATGQALMKLVRASSPGGTAADLLSSLRGPVGVDRAATDWLERVVLRDGIESAQVAMAKLNDRGIPAPPGWSRLSSDGPADLGQAVEEAITAIQKAIVDGGVAGAPESTIATELQTGTAIVRAVRELEEIGEGKVSPSNFIEALNSGAIRTWAVPTVGTVRIASPYSLRAKRFEYMFIVSLQESGLGDAGRSGPFLTEESRLALGLPEHTDPELQELYLFYSCLTVPTRGLYLSSRIADDGGSAEFPSPLVAAVEALFENDGEGIRRAGRKASEILVRPGAAPSADELSRAVIASGGDDAGLLDLPEGEPERLAERIRRATGAEARTRRIAPLECATVLDELRAKDHFSPTALEAFTECPYRWFIEKAVRPSRFGPEPEAMARGRLIHEVLAELYRERPGRVPRSDDLQEWVSAVAPAVESHAADGEIGLGSSSPEHVMLRMAAVDAICDHLGREARAGSPSFFPLEVETGFGLDPDGHPALEMDGWKLSGRIDRIDVSGDARTGVGRRGVVFDYKTGTTSVTTLAETGKGRKLQLQLYLHALRKIWQVEPTAALYLPVCRGDGRPRGMIDPDFADDVAYLNPFGTDVCDDLGRSISEAVEMADEAVARIRGGLIDHDPADCPVHCKHPATPDPRLAEAR